MTAGPSSTARAILILTRMGGRRFLNRLGAAFRRRSRKPDGKRRGTPGKSRLGFLLFPVLLVLFLPQGILLSSGLIARLAELVGNGRMENGDHVPVRRECYRSLFRIEQSMAVAPSTELPPEVQALARERREWKAREVRDLLQREVYRDEAMRSRDFARGLFNEAGERRLQELTDRFIERGIAGFRPEGPAAAFLDDSIWPGREAEPRMLVGLALTLALLSAAILFATLGTANQDLGQVEWSLEWLFTFPLRARSLFLAKTVEYAFLNAFAWSTVYPLTLAMLWSAGVGWWSLALGALATFYISSLLAAIRLAAETWLRKSLALSRLKNIQALFTILGILSLYAVIYLGVAESLPEWFTALVWSVPDSFVWAPPALPVLLCRSGASLGPWTAALACLSLFFLAAGAVASAFLVRGGLITTGGGAFAGKRGAPTKRAWSSGAVRGIVGKELRLLLRDRNFLVQTLVVPICLIGFQVLINPALLDAAGSDFRHGAALAFGIGAYVLIFGGFSVLAVEGQSLWLLYTLPRKISDVMRQKTRLWGAVGAVYVMAILGVIAWRSPGIRAEAIPSVMMAVAGVVIYAFIAAGIGVLATNPLEQHAARKMRPGPYYLYMLLASMYGYGIYAPSAWNQLALFVLCSLLAYAIWQKVSDRLPYLLDPVQTPPPRIGLSDGLMAALAFFSLQGFFMIIFLLAGEKDFRDISLGGRLTLAFVIAGAIVVASSLFLFWRLGVPDLLRTLGLARQVGDARSLGSTVATGAAGGLAAAIFGVAYLQAMDLIPFLTRLKDESLPFALPASDVETRLWITGLAILAAPPFEEYIFRGLVFRGMRRSMPLGLSILASAAIFAIVHPPIAVIPVFVLGTVAAWSFERTGHLAAPIVVHMVYNAVVVLVGGASAPK